MMRPSSNESEKSVSRSPRPVPLREHQPIGSQAWLKEFMPVARKCDHNTDSQVGIVFLGVELPGRAPTLGAFIVLDHREQEVVVRARSSWGDDIDPIDREILLGTRQMIESLFDDFGFESGRVLVNEFSNTIRASEEQRILPLDQPGKIADRLSVQLFG